MVLPANRGREIYSILLYRAGWAELTAWVRKQFKMGLLNTASVAHKLKGTREDSGRRRRVPHRPHRPFSSTNLLTAGSADMAAEDQGQEMMVVANGGGGNDDEGKREISIGFRFKPTDEELVEFYLLPRLQGRPTVANDAIIEANVYEFHPDRGEDAWFFLSPRTRAYQKGSRAARKTGDGCGRWKSSMATKAVEIDGITFSKNSLNYFVGTLKNEQKTKWLMRELSIPEYEIERGTSATLDEYVLCKIYVSPMHKAIKDEASATSACEEAQHTQATAESELPEIEAGKRSPDVQSPGCATVRKRPCQGTGSPAIGSSHASGADAQAQPAGYNDHALVPRPTLLTQLPQNTATPYDPNSSGQMTTMLPPPKLGSPEPRTSFRPLLPLNCCDDNNWWVLQSPDSAAYRMPQQGTMAFASPSLPPHDLNYNDDDRAEIVASPWPPDNNHDQCNAMAQAAGDQGEATAPCTVNAEDQVFAGLAYINTSLAAGDQGEATAAYAGSGMRGDSVFLEWDEFYLEDL
ncbi:hypothetical protein QOZ80_6AG0537400 [Eleusine coracana subsp. coracana]|nr:hypothetical protein QOZ80_6AG0537400 [Eleusine coracana subsp. coracana]